MLTDQLLPGMERHRRREGCPVHPTDVAFQGVSVPAGKSQWCSGYEPSSFRTGFCSSASGVVVLLVLLVTGMPAWRWWRDGARPATSDDDAMAVPSS